MKISTKHLLSYRLIRCPACDAKSLVRIEAEASATRCQCGEEVSVVEHMILAANHDIERCYGSWDCPDCSEQLLVPLYSPSRCLRCPCGRAYGVAGAGVSNTLDRLSEAFLGDDPLLDDHVLGPLRAAKRYDYEVEKAGENRYHVRNPTTGSAYNVSLSTEAGDVCDCNRYVPESGCCAHTEHVRLKTGLPSLASELSAERSYAYAWFDGVSAPARLRVGCVGRINDRVRKIVQRFGPIVSADSLRELSAAFQEEKLTFRMLPSARLKTLSQTALPYSEQIREYVLANGKHFLRSAIPHLYSHQVEGAIFLAGNQRALLLDEMGLGKTIQALAAAALLREYGGAESCLILAPKSVLPHWKREIKGIFGRASVATGETKPERVRMHQAPQFFKLCTPESYRSDFPETPRYDLLIVDEIHRARTSSSKIHHVLRNSESRFFFGLTGTAVESSLTDLYNILSLVKVPALETPMVFHALHCNSDIWGQPKSSYDSALFWARYSDSILRRTKANTLSDLPPATVHEVALDLNVEQEKMAEPICSELEAIRDRLQSRGYDREDFERHRYLVNRVVEVSDACQLLDPTVESSSKIDWLREFLSERCLKKQDKVVLFTRWTRMLELVSTLCSQIGVEQARLTGSHSQSQRQEAVDAFSEASAGMAFLSTDAGGVGINLQCASVVVNIEPSWNPSMDSQRCQRVHRIGQTTEVEIYSMLTPLDLIFVKSVHGRKVAPMNQIESSWGKCGAPSVSWAELEPALLTMMKGVTAL